jgi:hypothetical protein
MMSFDDAFGQPQAQPGSYFFFRGKKRLEKLGSNCLWDSRARICHGEPYPRSSVPVPLCCWRDSQANLSTSRDGVDTVAQEIGNELANLINHPAERSEVIPRFMRTLSCASFYFTIVRLGRDFLCVSSFLARPPSIPVITSPKNNWSSSDGYRDKLLAS